MSTRGTIDEPGASRSEEESSREFSPAWVFAVGALRAKTVATAVLEFARGPALHWAVVIMVAGFFWRGVDFALRRGEPNLHWARKGLHIPNRRWQIDSYTMHAGLLIAMFGFAPHILFIYALTGVQWPSLPIAVVLAAAVVSLGSMVAVLIHRVVTPGAQHLFRLR